MKKKVLEYTIKVQVDPGMDVEEVIRKALPGAHSVEVKSFVAKMVEAKPLYIKAAAAAAVEP